MSAAQEKTVTDANAQFEDWYVQNAFDYAANPIGSGDCGLMRRAWHAAVAATGKQQVGEVQGDVLQLANQWRHVFDGDGHDMSGANKNTLRRFIQAIDHLAARQPVAQEPVIVPGTPTSCKACGSADLSWFAHSRNKSQVTEGRLCSRDVECVFVLGCDECSETLHVVTADTIAGFLAAPPAQGIDLNRLVPPEWLSELIGGQMDDLTPGQAWRQGFNQCRERTLLLVEQALCFPADHKRDAAPGVGNG